MSARILIPFYQTGIKYCNEDKDKFLATDFLTHIADGMSVFPERLIPQIAYPLHPLPYPLLKKRLILQITQRLYNQGAFNEAAKQFTGCFYKNPNNQVTQIYLKRCQ